MKSKHIYLNLFLIDYPVTAITSIIHRITGVFIFLSTPVIFYFFRLSLQSNSSFVLAKSLISQLHLKVFIFFIFLSFIYHMLFGIKHIIMDFGFFESKSSSKNMSIIFLCFVCFLIILSILI
ncbi:MAG TPA: succinate dehydrogenase, cytochrome b556 subunit [Candidatus Azoamicus sp. OHIO1]